MTRPPMVGAALWTAVVDAAGGSCQCRGACGSKHSPIGVRTPGVQYRCQATRELIAAPADVSTPLHEAVAAPAAELAAWCPRCHTAALAKMRSAARKAPPQHDALFDTSDVPRPRQNS